MLIERMTSRRLFSIILSFILAFSLTLVWRTPAYGTLGLFNVLLPQANLEEVLPNNGKEFIVERCVYLDGRCIFTIAAPRSEMETRLNYIQTQLNKEKRKYKSQETETLNVYKESKGNLYDIFVNIDGTPTRLMTVTGWDAQLRGEEPETRADHLIGQIEDSLRQSREDQSPGFYEQRAAIAAGVLVLALILNGLGRRWRRKIHKQQEREMSFPQDNNLLATQLSMRQVYNVQEVKLRLSQLLQGGTVAGAIYIIVGLFPQTRIGQIWLINIFKYPLRIGLIFLIAYFIVRLSYALIAKFNRLIAEGALEAFTFITQESNQRLQLRVNTFSQVMRGMVTAVVFVIALFIALWSVSIDIAPLLAGAGIIGLAVSFAAQSLLKDVINGFCIILEDQYAVGDVISVGDVAGFVENINLRITQIRDPAGQLITIPNSEVRIVANLSNQWSRADLNIPIAYQTDVDQALELIGKVAQAMSQDGKWKTMILEDPLVLGVDSFSERGILIKVWIKTQPLKQWEVAREYRRRLKNAFAEAGIAIPPPQQEIWLHSHRPAYDVPTPAQASTFESHDKQRV